MTVAVKVKRELGAAQGRGVAVKIDNQRVRHNDVLRFDAFIVGRELAGHGESDIEMNGASVLGDGEALRLKRGRLAFGPLDVCRSHFAPHGPGGRGLRLRKPVRARAEKLDAHIRQFVPGTSQIQNAPFGKLAECQRLLVLDSVEKVQHFLQNARFHLLQFVSDVGLAETGLRRSVQLDKGAVLVLRHRRPLFRNLTRFRRRYPHDVSAPLLRLRFSERRRLLKAVHTRLKRRKGLLRALVIEKQRHGRFRYAGFVFMAGRHRDCAV